MGDLRIQNASVGHDLPPVCSADGVKARLSLFGLKPNKALGQNFLIDTVLRDEMVSAMPVQGLPVLEIGPGFGALTEALLSAGAERVLAVEKDAAMVRVLEATLVPQYKNLRILHEDILRISLRDLYLALAGRPLYIAGNLPYYITTPIVLQFLGCDLPIKGMTFMVQQEAADRFFAQPGDKNYGPLTVIAKTLYTCEPGIKLSPAAYYPQPDVSSATVTLLRNGRVLPEGFPAFLKSAFCMRRKTLLNNLLAAGLPRTQIEAAISGLPSGVRAEALFPEALADAFVRLNEGKA